MRRSRLLPVLVLLCLLPATPALAQGALAGSYAVIGWNPGENQDGPPSYKGDVEIRALGQAYAFEGLVDGVAYKGNGLADPGAASLCFAFRDAEGKDAGLVFLKGGPDRLEGFWTSLDDMNGQLGKEIWTRKP